MERASGGAVPLRIRNSAIPAYTPPIWHTQLPTTLLSGRYLARHVSTPSEHFDEYLEFCRPLSDFLLPDADLPDNLRLSAEKVTKFYRALDIVTPDSHKSACFTKGYSQRFEGTGSFLLLPDDNSTTRASGDVSKNVDDFPKLRYFHSQEVANLMCFPPSFKFPPEISEKQRLRLLGNSINVFVVAHVMYWAFSPKTQG
ncbi:tRNA (cytosine-5-)-methyltransferase [Sparganum proliferum]